MISLVFISGNSGLKVGLGYGLVLSFFGWTLTFRCILCLTKAFKEHLHCLIFLFYEIIKRLVKLMAWSFSGVNFSEIVKEHLFLKPKLWIFKYFKDKLDSKMSCTVFKYISEIFLIVFNIFMR